MVLVKAAGQSCWIIIDQTFNLFTVSTCVKSNTFF